MSKIHKIRSTPKKSNRNIAVVIKSKGQAEHYWPNSPKNIADRLINQQRFNGEISVSYLDLTFDTSLRYPALGPGVVINSVGTEIKPIDEFISLYTQEKKQRSFYYGDTPKGDAIAYPQKRTVANPIECVTITFHPRDALLFNQLQQYGIPLKPFCIHAMMQMKQMFEEQTGAQVISVNLHANEGCLHTHVFHSYVERDIDASIDQKGNPRPRLLRPRSGIKGNPTECHAGISLVATERLLRTGFFPPQDGVAPNRWLANRIRRLGDRLPIDVLLSTFVDRLAEQFIGQEIEKNPALGKVVDACNDIYALHIYQRRGDRNKDGWLPTLRTPEAEMLFTSEIDFHSEFLRMKREQERAELIAGCAVHPDCQIDVVKMLEWYNTQNKVQLAQKAAEVVNDRLQETHDRIKTATRKSWEELQDVREEIAAQSKNLADLDFDCNHQTTVNAELEKRIENLQQHFSECSAELKKLNNQVEEKSQLKKQIEEEGKELQELQKQTTAALHQLKNANDEIEKRKKEKLRMEALGGSQLAAEVEHDLEESALEEYFLGVIAEEEGIDFLRWRSLARERRKAHEMQKRAQNATHSLPSPEIGS